MRLKLRIELSESENPMIIREMWVPTGITFDHLHQLIQAAMGWENYHLYSFQEHPETRYFAVVSPYSEEFGIDATGVLEDTILFSNFNFNQMIEDGQSPEKLNLYMTMAITGCMNFLFWNLTEIILSLK